MRDYVAIARGYEDAVLDGTEPACSWVKLAVSRNRRDLKRQRTKRFPYYFDEAAAVKVCAAVEQFPHTKGKLARAVRQPDGSFKRPTIELPPWFTWIVTCAFGWKRTSDHLRRFRTVLILVPRKNSKTTYSAPLMLYAASADGEIGAEVYSVATMRDQARISFDIAKKQAQRTPSFTSYFGVQPFARSIEIAATDSKIEPLSSDADTLDGLNGHFFLVDELHAHKVRDVWDVAETSTGSRDQPMMWGITTAGVDTGGICFELLTYLRKILDGALKDDTFFGVEYTIDEADKARWDQPDVCRKANPNYGLSVRPDDLERLAAKARHSPSALNNFLTKRLNVWVSEASPWLNLTHWRRCAEPGLTFAAFREASWAIVCVDLAETRDIASIVAVGVWPDGAVKVCGRHYLPEAAIEASPVAQMSGWVKDGWLIPISGDVQDFDYLTEEVERIATETGAVLVGFDRAQAAHMMQSLQKTLGEEAVEIIKQNAETFDPPMKAIETMLKPGRFAHPDDPVLSWMVANIHAKPNNFDELIPVKPGGKKDSPHKIDGGVAMLMGLSRLMRRGGEGSVYDERAANGASVLTVL